MVKSNPGCGAATLACVLERWSDERDTLHALAAALEQSLMPEDKTNPKDTDNLMAWRLSQVLHDLLVDCEDFHALKKMALPDLEAKS